MAVSLYAICGGEAQPHPGTGLGGQTLRVIRSAGLGALVSDNPAAPRPGLGEAELWQHERAIEELMAANDVLPVRFGETLESESAVRAMLESRREEFEAALQRIAGACELSVRAAWREDTPTGALQSGTSYLAARADAESRAAALARQLQRRLAPFSRASRLRRVPQPSFTLACAFLVARSMVSGFMAEVGRVDSEVSDTTLVCTGPWPPYSFVQSDRAHV
jgi:hypothetical protein